MKTFIHVTTTLVAFTLIMIVCTALSPSRAKKIPLNKALPDSLVSVHLGTTLAEILLNSSSVTLYSVKGKEETDKNDFVLEPHYVRDSLIGVLSSDAAAVLEFLLISDENNYSIDTVMVRSPYMPQLEFEFARKRKVAHVLLSTTDFSWTVIYDGKKQFNYNYTDHAAIERFCEMILKKEK